MSYDPAFQQRISEMLQHSQYWPPQDLQNFQAQQLSQLVAFSLKNVPFYKDRLAGVLKPDGSLDWAAWRQVPILTRQDLIDHREAMLPATLPPGHGHVADHTGTGTTGKPVTSRHNSLVHLVSKAGLFRAFEWYGVSHDSVFCEINGDDPDASAWPDGDARGPWGPHWDEASARGSLWYINHFTTSDHLAEFLQRRSVSYFAGRPSRMHGAALAAERQGFTHQLKACFALGENITDDMRRDCKRIWGADVYSLYGSKEVYNIGHQCPSSLNLHVNEEMMLFEVLDDQNRPCKPGERGRAIVTSFFNTSQPFIRYDLGDQVVMAERCSCGRTLATIQSMVGRTVHMLRFPGGRLVGLTMPRDLRALIGAERWQFAQVRPLEIEVRYIPHSDAGTPDFDALTAEVITRTDPRVTVSFKAMAELPLTKSGKFIEIVCELPPAS